MSRHLLRKALRLPQAALKRLVTGLLQLVLLANRPARLARSGFVLPTTVLLVLMVVLTATALTYRSFTRSDMAISQREQQVIANAATPALDRARAKIEFLFNKDSRLSSGLPTGDFLASMMLTVPYEPGVVALTGDPFTLPGETRLDINNDTILDNAWSFVSDANGETIVYSILVDDQATRADRRATAGAGLQSVTSPINQDKANALVTRTGPQATTEATSICSNARAEKGWQVVNNGSTSALQKNFQINVFVPNANDANRTVEAFEFQQSRIANRGNKWAAWFRYDLEIAPGAPFTINGAMHTDSSLMATSNGGGSLTSYMISSQHSCVYSKEASELTVGAKNGSFEGQILHGSVANNTFGSSNPTIFHIFNGDRIIPITDKQLTANTANAKDSVDGGTPAAVAVNPLKLFTEDILEHTAGGWTRDKAEWEKNQIFTGGRIFNKKVAKPFVDDFSRADDRWGPKPRYSETDASLAVSASQLAGSKIPTTNTALTDPTIGLDGYWERQAVKNGLRLIVGERLQLGNPVEWNRNPATNAVEPDRLYPPSATTQPTVGSKIGANEYRQKRALRDNLAAVQSMVVYHYKTNNGEFPAACMAMTAHPGSQQSIIDSRTFRNYPTATTLLRTDFLRGQGTNGWEFQFPAAFNTPTLFATQIGNTQPLGIALRNLARFAGDPKGGAPYFQAVQDTNVHPAPYFNMWGDFSPLRRIFEEYLDAGVAYNDLSAADKATLHSAACTVSMLAYNVSSDLAEGKKLLENYTDPPSINPFLNQGVTAVQRIADYIDDRKYLPNASLNGGEAQVRTALNLINKNQAWNDTQVSTNSQCANDPTGIGQFQKECDSADFFAEFTYSQWETVLSSLVNSNAANLAGLRALAEKANTLNILLRDRELGFRAGYTQRTFGDITFTSGNEVTWDPDSGLINPVGQGSTTRIYKSSCNPNIFRSLAAGGPGGTARVALAGIIGCSQNDTLNAPIRFPSLYYLFPMDPHDHDGTGVHQQPDGVNLPVPGSPVTPPRPQLQVAEEYITNPYVRSVNPPATEPVAPASAPYRVVGTDPIDGIDAIAAVPRTLSEALTNWRVPVAASTTALTNPNAADQAFLISTGASTGINVPFLDKGLFNGREQMAVRVLDIDLNRLTNSQNGTDYWIPDVACIVDPKNIADAAKSCDIFAEGIVYAFREDAVREDEIVRPKKSGQNASACLTVATITSADCRMVTTPGSEQDPPLTTLGISLKPVDFVADPDRRPHGFRLRNGDDMSRNYARNVGMTLVTDNSVYIQGDFNRHVATTGPIEEFTALVGNVDWNNNNFYNNRTQAVLNQNFAQPDKDKWRPVEILADAVTILSNGFVDGDADDTFTEARPGSAQATNTSYMNQSRPNAAQTVIREGGTTAPVFIGRNGNAFVGTAPTATAINTLAPGNWTGIPDGENARRQNNRTVANPISVNALFIAGIVPNRPNQGYGGLNNYPRLTESWQNTSLNIAGSFFQLNFSTASTGPFEHDAWEPGSDPVVLVPGTPNVGEELGYYFPPIRRWGYDPALLYYPPAAAARRFITVGTPRSEYYRELPADDPYIVNLRCANRAGAAPVFDANIRGNCPA
ncbi:MAG TPA: hormogonium polysaccharide biosynthesis protein HpsA [Nodosilinea sp.]|nr:hormogonium polysaccharide biosynthesis protein HpsA [Nodosilinea sp.]